MGIKMANKILCNIIPTDNIISIYGTFKRDKCVMCKGIT